MTVGVLDPAEADAVARAFGVGELQVVRDHLISHALAAIAEVAGDDVVFFGGTALSRTLLTDLRLSEDIDLIALGDRRAIADRIERNLVRRLRRTVGAPTFAPGLAATAHPHPSVMEVGGVRVQIQLLTAIGYPDWPTEVAALAQRYADAPPATMRVLTPSAFAAAKLASWADRAAARDLYDMWGLAEAGCIDGAAAALFGRFGSATSAARVPFETVPSDKEWDIALGHQCRPRVGPRDAATVVSEAWFRAAMSDVRPRPHP